MIQPAEEEVKLNFLSFWVGYRYQREACPPFNFDEERRIIHSTLRELDALCVAYQKPRYRSLLQADFPGGHLPQSIGINIVFTGDKHYVGAGSGGLGAAKVFWLPYTASWISEETQAFLEKLKHIDEPDMGIDNIYVLCHEVYHALGGEKEFTNLFQYIAMWNSHIASFGKVLTPSQILNELRYQASRAPRRVRLAMELMRNLTQYADNREYLGLTAAIQQKEKRREV